MAAFSFDDEVTPELSILPTDSEDILDGALVKALGRANVIPPPLTTSSDASLAPPLSSDTLSALFLTSSAGQTSSVESQHAQRASDPKDSISSLWAYSEDAIIEEYPPPGFFIQNVGVVEDLERSSILPELNVIEPSFVYHSGPQGLVIDGRRVIVSVYEQFLLRVAGRVYCSLPPPEDFTSVMRVVAYYSMLALPKTTDLEDEKVRETYLQLSEAGLDTITSVVARLTLHPNMVSNGVGYTKLTSLVCESTYHKISRIYPDAAIFVNFLNMVHAGFLQKMDVPNLLVDNSSLSVYLDQFGKGTKSLATATVNLAVFVFNETTFQSGSGDVSIEEQATQEVNTSRTEPGVVVGFSNMMSEILRPNSVSVAPPVSTTTYSSLFSFGSSLSSSSTSTQFVFGQHSGGNTPGSTSQSAGLHSTTTPSFSFATLGAFSYDPNPSFLSSAADSLQGRGAPNLPVLQSAQRSRPSEDLLRQGNPGDVRVIRDTTSFRTSLAGYEELQKSLKEVIDNQKVFQAQMGPVLPFVEEVQRWMVGLTTAVNAITTRLSELSASQELVINTLNSRDLLARHEYNRSMLPAEHPTASQIIAERPRVISGAGGLKTSIIDRLTTLDGSTDTAMLVNDLKMFLEGTPAKNIVSQVTADKLQITTIRKRLLERVKTL